MHSRALFGLVLAALVTLGIPQFGFVPFMVIPVMAQVAVGLAFLLICLYLFYRRSVLVAGTAVVVSAAFWALQFLSIQGIENNLEMVLFFLTATGILFAAIYCMFIGARFWSIRGGAE